MFPGPYIWPWPLFWAPEPHIRYHHLEVPLKCQIHEGQSWTSSLHLLLICFHHSITIFSLVEIHHHQWVNKTRNVMISLALTSKQSSNPSSSVPPSCLLTLNCSNSCLYSYNVWQTWTLSHFSPKHVFLHPVTKVMFLSYKQPHFPSAKKIPEATSFTFKKELPAPRRSIQNPHELASAYFSSLPLITPCGNLNPELQSIIRCSCH